MKVLVVTQYFYPEEFKINNLVEGLVSHGHKVTVLTGKPNYPKGHIFAGYRFWGIQYERLYGAEVIRVPLIPRGSSSSFKLSINYLSFVLFSCWYVLTHKNKISTDKIFVWDTSPILQAYAGILAKKRTGASLSMWVQDLWPESVAATKSSMGNGVMQKVLLKIVRGIYWHFDTLFIQAPGFEKSIKEKGNFKAKYIYAPNWAEDIFCDTTKINKETYKDTLPEGFKVMFAGNIGMAQDFDTILKAAQIVHDNKDIKWVVLGDGRCKEYVEQKIQKMGLHDTVFLLGRYPISEMPSFFVHADALLVTLKNEYIFSLTIPSKIQAYMAFGRPILTMLNGEGNYIVEQAKCGLTACAGDEHKLAENVITLYKSSYEKQIAMGNNGKQYYSDTFNKEQIINRIINNL